MKVMVTGAGGSIGSAICRSIDKLNPELLIMYEISEYALYKIDQELTCNRIAVLGDVKDKKRLSEFTKDVDIIYHTAAYKHVPMLEGVNAEEGIRNNVEGTRAVMECAAGTVVLLSTDKAIKPLSVMGKSKYEAERIALSYNQRVVRLGNILESSGSVIPKFREQIASGGPVTVTHPEVTRYFIPMEKAVEFILSVADKEPGIHMIPMGEPIKILDIAKSMIGDKDIEIQFIGLRPGEKLHEDLYDGE